MEEEKTDRSEQGMACLYTKKNQISIARYYSFQNKLNGNASIGCMRYVTARATNIKV